MGADVGTGAEAGAGWSVLSSLWSPQPSALGRLPPWDAAPSPSSLWLQVFIATNSCEAQAPYSRAMAALLQHVDAFSTAATLAQALPVLHGRCYLDIASMRCEEELGRSWGQLGGALAPPAPRWWPGAHQHCGGFSQTR